MKLAILEDLREVAEMLKEVFSEQEDMSCKQVYFNAEDAMQFLTKNPVDILIVDIGLPKASGIDPICMHRSFFLLYFYNHHFNF